MNGFQLSVSTFDGTLASTTFYLEASAFLQNYPQVSSPASSFKITINDCKPESKDVKQFNLNMLFVNYTQDNEIFFMFDQRLSLYENPVNGSDLVVDVLSNYT
jgi:hypothetical protein